MLKNKIKKHMTAVSKNVYFDVLHDIVDKYNNTYHRKTELELKPKSCFCAKHSVNSNANFFSKMRILKLAIA